jgi:hypothetical protein
MTERGYKPPAELEQLKGNEPFSTGSKVLDFWRWALGDLRMNTARGFPTDLLPAQLARPHQFTGVERVRQAFLMGADTVRAE